MPDLPLKRKCVNLSCGRKSKLKINNTKSLNPVHRHHLARAFSGVWISGAWEKVIFLLNFERFFYNLFAALRNRIDKTS